MFKALAATGLIADGSDNAKWRKASAQEAAKMLADANIDPSKISDPAVAAAVKLARRVAAGDANAARELVACFIAGRTQAV